MILRIWRVPEIKKFDNGCNRYIPSRTSSERRLEVERTHGIELCSSGWGHPQSAGPLFV